MSPRQDIKTESSMFLHVVLHYDEHFWEISGSQFKCFSSIHFPTHTSQHTGTVVSVNVINLSQGIHISRRIPYLSKLEAQFHHFN